jgi:hypothetical protein
MKLITENYFTKHADITTIYKDNKNRVYAQKLLKCEAGWLGFRDQIVCLK